MAPGTSPEGEEYDGVMRELVCNHVAIVPDGRAGDDVLVHDSKPKGYKAMTKLEKFWAKVAPKLARDADPDALKGELDDIVNDEDQTQAERDNESEAERLKEREERERKDRDRDRAEDNGEEDKDAEILALKNRIAELEDNRADDAEETEKKVSMAWDAMRKEQRDLREAERTCRPFVGDLACDSAEELYRATLEARGIEAKDIHRSALKAMVNHLAKPSMANDSAPLSHGGREGALKMIMGDK